MKHEYSDEGEHAQQYEHEHEHEREHGQKPELYLLYLDDYHVADPLFMQSLARSLSRRPDFRCVMVHGSGQHAQQALEAEGIFRARVNGVLPVETPREHELVERALREENRRITSILNDAVVPCVGIIGSERGLLVMKNSTLLINGTDWLESLAGRGVVPVIGCHASEAGSRRTGEIGTGLVAAALVWSMSVPVVVVAFTKTNLPGVMHGPTPLSELEAGRVSEDIAADSAVLRDLVAQEIPVLLTNSTRLVDLNGPIGTRLHAST